MEYMNKYVNKLFVLFTALVFGTLYVSYILDDYRQTAYDKYKACVLEQYHTTPERYYQEHRQAPLCK